MLLLSIATLYKIQDYNNELLVLRQLDRNWGLYYISSRDWGLYYISSRDWGLYYISSRDWGLYYISGRDWGLYYISSRDCVAACIIDSC